MVTVVVTHMAAAMAVVMTSVVVTMVRCPPQCSLLRRHPAQPREHELKGAARFVAAMRKVPVIAGRDSEHPNGVQRQAHDQCSPAHARPDCQEARRVDSEKRHAGTIVDRLVRAAGRHATSAS